MPFKINLYCDTCGLAAVTRHENVTLSPCVTVFAAALVVKVVPSGLSTNMNQM